jgi:hypothetical protein
MGLPVAGSILNCGERLLGCVECNHPLMLRITHGSSLVGIRHPLA